jgi:hypothetical protein
MQKKTVRFCAAPLAVVTAGSIVLGSLEHDEAVVPHHPETHQDPFEPLNANGRAAFQYLASGASNISSLTPYFPNARRAGGSGIWFLE